ncbi:MAG: hypothetical protein ACI8TQ_000565 [Planctomycetota bacterium]
MPTSKDKFKTDMTHSLSLEPSEARVLGVLIEKALTVPDQYPLSLNALQLGCNQKSNRDPKIEMMEGEVFSSVERLRMMQLAGRVTIAGSRVERFGHSANQVLGTTDAELAVLAELLMRGAQTKGELRTRANRMSPFATQEDLGEVLLSLRDKQLLADLPPLPGSRAARVGETLSTKGQAEASNPVSTPAHSAAPSVAPASFSPASASISPAASHSTSDLQELTSRVARLENQLAKLAEALGEPLDTD